MSNDTAAFEKAETAIEGFTDTELEETIMAVFQALRKKGWKRSRIDTLCFLASISVDKIMEEQDNQKG